MFVLIIVSIRAILLGFPDYSWMPYDGPLCMMLISPPMSYEGFLEHSFSFIFLSKFIEKSGLIIDFFIPRFHQIYPPFASPVPPKYGRNQDWELYFQYIKHHFFISVNKLDVLSKPDFSKGNWIITNNCVPIWHKYTYGCDETS